MFTIFRKAPPSVVSGYGKRSINLNKVVANFEKHIFLSQTDLTRAWSEHIVTVFLACQIIIKNVQVQLTVKGKTTPDSYTPTPKSSCAQNVVDLKPMFMDDNAWRHRALIVQHFLQQEAVQTIPWPAMSPDMNPIEHVWNFIGRKINQHYPKCQNIDELRTAILQEW
jgi:transposase